MVIGSDIVVVGEAALGVEWKRQGRKYSALQGYLIGPEGLKFFHTWRLSSGFPRSSFPLG